MKKMLTLCTLPLLLMGCTGPKKAPFIGDKYEDLAGAEGFESVQYQCSVGDWFTEVDGGRFLSENSHYSFKFTSSKTDPSFTVKSSNEEHATVEVKDTEVFIVHTHTPGDTILTVYNSLDEIAYRNIIRVRPAYDEKSVLKMMYDTEYYKSLDYYAAYIGNWRFVVNDDTDFPSVTIAGGDDMERNVQCSANLEFYMYMADRDVYAYYCRDVDTNSQTTRLCQIQVARAGDVAYVYYNTAAIGAEAHLLTMVYNIDTEYVYEYMGLIKKNNQEGGQKNEIQVK